MCSLWEETAAVLLSDGTLERSLFRGSDALYEVVRRACCNDPGKRFGSMAAFFAAWMDARILDSSSEL